MRQLPALISAAVSGYESVVIAMRISANRLCEIDSFLGFGINVHRYIRMSDS